MGHFSLMERGKLILQSDSNEKCKGAKPRHLFYCGYPRCPREARAIPQSPPDELKTHEISWVFCYPNERSSLQRVWVTKRPAVQPLGF